MSIQATDPENVARKRSRRRGCWVAFGLLGVFFAAYAAMFFSDVGPGDDSDLLPPPSPVIPDEENMAYWIGEAVKDLESSLWDLAVAEWLGDPTFEPDLYEERSREVARFVEANPDRFSSIDRAAECEAYAYSLKLYGWEVLEIEDLIALGVHRSISVGDRGRAVDLLRKSRKLMRKKRHSPGWLNHPTACFRSWHYLIQTETDRAVLLDLLEEFRTPILEEGWEESWVRERYRIGCLQLESSELIKESIETLGWALKPRIGYSPRWLYRHNRTRAIFAREFRGYLEQIERGHPLQATPPASPGLRWLQILGGNSTGEMLFDWVRSDYPVEWAQVRAVLASDRLLFVSIALRLRLMESGAYPSSLEGLVPELLPEVPRDPENPEGGPLRWDSDRRLLWSLGKGQTDEGGISEEQRAFSFPWSHSYDRTLQLGP